MARLLGLGLLWTAAAGGEPARGAEAQAYHPPEVRVPADFVAELAAAPPLVQHPLMAGFDDRGRLFIAESAGENLKRAELEEELPNFIRMLEDTDGDGVFDKSTIFADKMTFPQGALWYRSALYVCSSGGLWRLEDTNDDGVADKREMIVGGFGYTGNAADIHGPFLGPTGRLYWCDGRHGHEFVDSQGRVTSKGKAARIFSCLPDGSDVQTHCGGGMDNPVEIDFLPTGEMLGTVNLFYRQRGDCLVHWVRGGVYPRYDQPDCLAEFPSTGEPLTEVFNYGHVAVSGCTRYRSGEHGFGKQYADNFFVTQFNTHKVVRTVLTRDGGTFRAEAHEFLSSPSSDFHPTDVLEDADGSLLVIDTGGWFRIGCPTSQIAKPNVLGAIWRIRKKDGHKLVDPRGGKIAWNKLGDDDLAKQLADERFAVRERATDLLAQRGEQIVPAVAKMLQQQDVSTRQDAVWTLARIGTPAARRPLRERLTDLAEDERVILAAQHSLGMLRDGEAVGPLAYSAFEASPARIREAATAIGRIGPLGGEEAVAGLLTIVPEDADRVTQHAYTRALIDIDKFDYLMARFFLHRTPATLIALREMPSSRLKREDVMPLLTHEDHALRQTVLETITARRDWSQGIDQFIRDVYESRESRHTDLEMVHGAVVAFIQDKAVQKVVGEMLQSGPTQVFAREDTLLRAIGEAPLEKWPQSWRPGIVKALEDPYPVVRAAAVEAVVARSQAEFAPQLQAITEDRGAPQSVRTAAAGGLASFGKPLPETPFSILLSDLKADAAPTRLHAARSLGGARLNDEQLRRLAKALGDLGALEVGPLVAAFEQSKSHEVGLALVDGLKISPGRANVPAARLKEILDRYPAEATKNSRELLKSTATGTSQQEQRLDELLAAVEPGDAMRGREVFFGRRAACASCHRAGGEGGELGPDLSAIGARRDLRDLVEAIAFPSASLARGFESYTIATGEGRLHTGVIVRQTADALHLRTTDQNEVRIDRSSIEEMLPSPVSVMPQGIDRVLTSRELSDLLAYLQSLK